MSKVFFSVPSYKQTNAKHMKCAKVVFGVWKFCFLVV